MKIDRLVDSAVQQATGQRAAVILGRPAHRRWTKEDSEFLRSNLGVRPIDDIAVALGRTRQAIKIRTTRKGYTSASKHRSYYSRIAVSRMLGVDVKAVMKWDEGGLLKFERVPGHRVGNGNDRRRVHTSSFRRWVINPENFIYFLYDIHGKYKNIPHPGYAKLVAAAYKRWGDEWWTAGRAAKHHGVTDRTINKKILSDQLSAVRWGNWYIKKSHVIALQVAPGRGNWKKKNAL